MTDKIIVFCSCAPADAERIARHLVERRVAACVSVTPGTVSHYYWKGSLESSTECGLTIKSRRDLLPRLKEEIRQVHTYEVPEILALPVVDGSPEYLDWMDRELGLEP